MPLHEIIGRKCNRNHWEQLAVLRIKKKKCDRWRFGNVFSSVNRWRIEISALFSIFNLKEEASLVVADSLCKETRGTELWKQLITNNAVVDSNEMTAWERRVPLSLMGAESPATARSSWNCHPFLMHNFSSGDPTSLSHCCRPWCFGRVCDKYPLIHLSNMDPALPLFSGPGLSARVTAVDKTGFILDLMEPPFQVGGDRP